MEHAYLHAVGADVAEHGFDLPFEDVDGEAFHGIYAQRVLCSDSGDSRCGKASVGRDTLDIGLYAGATARVAAGDGEDSS